MAHPLDEETRDLFFLRCLRVTDDNRREVLIDRILLDRPYQLIADTMGLSRTRVRQLEADARRLVTA